MPISSAIPPKDFAGLKVAIATKAGELPKRLAQIAAFALDHPDEIAFGTVAKIASQAKVQPSALVRFSKALGYDGFSGLQDVFRSRLRGQYPAYGERMAKLRQHAKSASKPNLVLHGFCDAAEKSLGSLREKLDPGELDRAVAMLARAETICIVGLRRSFPAAAYMAYALGKLGVRSILADAVGGLGAEQAGSASAKDAVLAISFAPYAGETVAIARAAAAKGVPVAALTDGPLSPLARIADLWLEVAEADFEGFRSLAGTLTLAMTLTVAIAERKSKKPEPRIRQL